VKLEAVYDVSCFDNRVFAVAALRDGRLAAGCIDCRAHLVEVGAVATMLDGHTDQVTTMAVLLDGTLASGSWDNTVRLWDVGTRARFAWEACVATLAGHTGGVVALAVLADGRLASGLQDQSVRLWDVATRACVGVLKGHTGSVYALAALPDGRLASGSRDCTIRVWDARPAVVSAGAAVATAAAGDGAARATPVVVLEGHTSWVLALRPLPAGRLASGSVDDTVRLGRLPPL